MEGLLHWLEMLVRAPSTLEPGQVYFSCPGTDLGCMVSQGQSRAAPLGLGPSIFSFIFWILRSPQGPYLQETQPGTSEVCSWPPHQLSRSPQSGRSSWTLIQRPWRTSRVQLSLGGPVPFASPSVVSLELGGVSDPAC